jgi:hypothetical protein
LAEEGGGSVDGTAGTKEAERGEVERLVRGRLCEMAKDYLEGW